VFIEPDQIGERLRVERTRRGLSQRKLAHLVGVSPSLISQMESAKVQPSVATLMAVVTELRLNIDELFRVNGADDEPDRDHRVEGEATTPDPSVPGAAGTAPGIAPDVSTGGEATGHAPRMVQRAADRSMIRLSGGVMWERLTPDPDHLVDFLYITYPPGACSSEGNDFIRHQAREYIYVLSGQLEVQVVFEPMVLNAGDSIVFDSTRPHRLTNRGDVPAVAVVAVVHP
jgi:transcriptional regulator with XRE-family HTH domain/mannose-6-phosphate isomerase-like protein (cupin superfamily)